jgi:hypothetical protein
VSDIEQRLRDFAEAYPEDLFSPLTKEEVERLQSKGRHLLDRASAGMGRHFAPYAIQAADRIRDLEAALAEANDEISNLHDWYAKHQTRIREFEAALHHIADWPKNQLDGVDAARVAKTALGSAFDGGSEHG